MHSTRYIALFFVTVSVLGGPLKSGLRATQDPNSDRFSVTLTNRIFVPELGIDQELFSLVEEPGETRLPAIVQLFQPPSPAVRADLEEAGVQLTTFLGGSTYLAELSSPTETTKLVNLVRDELVRWAGPLRPEDKVQRQLWQREAENWALTADGLFKVLVTLSPELDKEAAGRLLGHHVHDPKPHGVSGRWAIEISWEALSELARERAVRWLEFGPLPMMPLGKE